MKHVQPCLTTKKDLESSFERSRGPVKLVQACLSVRKVLEGSFHHCGGAVRLVQACLCAERPEKAVLTSKQACMSLTGDENCLLAPS